jgi:predicted nucleic acid-binding protein
VTHNYVVVEATALVERRLGRPGVLDLHTRLLRPIEALWIDREVHQLALAAYLASPGASLVDRVSFELMNRRRIAKVFAFDRDFARQGFEVVP